MTDLILCGCGGKMGAAVRELASAREDCRIVAGVDLACQNSGLHFPVYRALSEVNEAADCIIDFLIPLPSPLHFELLQNSPEALLPSFVPLATVRSKRQTFGTQRRSFSPFLFPKYVSLASTY